MAKRKAKTKNTTKARRKKRALVVSTPKKKAKKNGIIRRNATRKQTTIRRATAPAKAKTKAKGVKRNVQRQRVSKSRSKPKRVAQRKRVKPTVARRAKPATKRVAAKRSVNRGKSRTVRTSPRRSARRTSRLPKKSGEISRLRQLVRNQASIIRELQGTRRVTPAPVKETAIPKGAKVLQKNRKGEVLAFSLPPYVGPLFGKTKFGQDAYASMLREVGNETEDFYGDASAEIAMDSNESDLDEFGETHGENDGD